MSNWTIARRLISAFVAIIALSLVFGAFALNNVSATKRGTSQLAANRYPGIVALYEIQGLLARNYGRLVTLLISPADQRTRYAADIASSSQEIDAALHRYDSSITTGEERTMFDTLKAHRDAFETASQNLIEICTAGHNDAAIAKVPSELAPSFNVLIDEDIAHLVEFDRHQAETAFGDITDSAGNGVKGVFIGIICEIAAVGIIGWLLVGGITRSLTQLAVGMNDGANQVAAAANRVSEGSQTLAEGASEQAASLEETSSSMEQMSSMTRRNSENALQANEIAKQTRSTADRGSADMAAMSDAMKGIKDSSDDIAKIIKTIDEIAFQTNILALNAAVEAARAGEAGLGFAVVADEVRNLAQRSAHAAKETASKIESAIARSGQGVDISNKVATTLNEIVAKARRMDELVAEVAAASREQTEGISQINSAIGQMDKITQSNSANAEKSSFAAQDLNAQAEKMKESVNKLVGLVGTQWQASLPSIPIAMRKFEAPKTSLQPVNVSARILKESRHHTIDASGQNVPYSIASRRNEIPLEGEFKNF